MICFSVTAFLQPLQQIFHSLIQIQSNFFPTPTFLGSLTPCNRTEEYAIASRGPLPSWRLPFVWSTIAQVYGHSRVGGFCILLFYLLQFISNAVFCNFCNLLTSIGLFFLHLQSIACVTFWKRCGDPFATLEFAPSFLFALHLTPSWAACSPPPARGGSLAFNSRFQLQFNSIRFNSISICFQFNRNTP